ncbi:unnamed protein product [Rodentolepis nana]|uniref:Uncharacterized protein n=1 Tax=Rodentolepis nana TaxID=102285 RepID=A0A0R3T671_RODNA|nr:unnamed protein product [Rodentolepis nana]
MVIGSWSGVNGMSSEPPRRLKQEGPKCCALIFSTRLPVLFSQTFTDQVLYNQVLQPDLFHQQLITFSAQLTKMG